MLAQIIGLIVDIGLGAIAYKTARASARDLVGLVARVDTLERRVQELAGGTGGHPSPPPEPGQ